MKIRTQFWMKRRLQAARTLVETMVAASVFSLVTLGVVYGHMFGLKQAELVESKLGASDVSRRAFNKMTSEIRSAKIWRVGTGTSSTFAPLTNGVTQQGNAVQINRTTDTNTFIRYYFDTSKRELRRIESGNQTAQLVARDLTNSMFFRAEDCFGNVKTDLSYKYVVRVVMEFCQYQYPLTKVGPGYYYDYYKMDIKVTPHCPDGV